MLPLLPGFPGELNQNFSLVGLTLYREQQTISRGGSSIFEVLKQNGIEDPSQYIQFYGLRNYGQLEDGRYATEIVYVHSKLMIVDDRRAIIGSANINDRSLMGDRDSEIGMVIED